MNKRSKLIWGFLSFIGFAIVLYSYFNTFIYSSNLKWSIPKTNNAKSQSFGGYQRYTKDAKINAESDNSKSYKDFETIVQNLETNFYKRKHKAYITLFSDPMNPSILTGDDAVNSKSGYYCYNKGPDMTVECGYQDNPPKYIKEGENIGNATLKKIKNNTAILELNNKDRTKIEFELNNW